MTTTIKPHLSTAELEGRYETAAEPIAKSHFHALWLLSRGYDLDEVAEILSFSTRWVRILIKRYNEGGPDLLGDQRAHNGTEPTILTPEALAALKERLQTPPDDGGQWSGPKIARWLAELPRAQGGARPARLGCAGRDRLLDPAAAAAAPACGERAGSRAPQKKLAARRCAGAAQASGREVEIWATDEHRIGLKPITRGVWAPIGERPVAVGHHRFEWLYVTGFVEPATGRTVWNVSNNISKAYFELVLADFAKSVGAGRQEAHRAAARQCRLARAREPRRARRHPARLPARPQSRAATRRASVGLRRRAARQPLLRDHRGPRQGRRPSAASPSRSSSR